MTKHVLVAALLAGLTIACLPILQGQEVVPAEPRQQAPRQQGIDPSDAVGAGDFYKASDLMGMSVQGSDGQVIGRVKDLLIDSRSEQVRYMLLDSGVAAQAGAEVSSDLLVVPAAVAEFNYFVDQPDQRFIRINFDRQRLTRAPRIPSVEIRGLRNPQWVVEVDQFYNVRARRAARPDLDRQTRERRQEIRQERRLNETTPQPSETDGQQPQSENNTGN
ncbi:MAG: PRC-barrel domain-containing protein [Planctomycetaceae bacterium]|nr:PRC-barrel domain-containing protein [Planctomycetaceae bacterium]